MPQINQNKPAKISMEAKNLFVTAAFVCGLFVRVQSGFAQGSLTPPGAPAPIMKTLDQVEARTIVNVAIKNSVSGNGANNYEVPAGNDLGLVGTTATSTSPWANISH